MHTSNRGDGTGAAPRWQRSRVAIALIGAAALTLGAGIGAAAAEEPSVVATSASDVSTSEAGAATSPEPPATVEPPVAEPVAAEPPVVEPPVVEPPAVELPVVEPPVAAEPSAVEPEIVEPTAAAPDPAADRVSEPGEARVAEAGAEKGKGSENPHNKVTLCHATNSEKNPYVQITVNANGSASGHLGHQGGRDIIPPFTYNDHGEEKSFGGQNWDAAGQEIWNNGCQPADPDPDPEPGSPVLSIDPLACIPGDAPLPESVAVTVSGLTESGMWTLTVTGGESGSATVQVTGNGTYSVPVNGVGTYSVTIAAGGEVADTASFTVALCPDPSGGDKPTLDVPGIPCLPVDAEIPGTVTVDVSGFSAPEAVATAEETVADVAYTLRISGGSAGEATVAVDGNGSYVLPLSGLGTYTVTLLAGDTVVASESVVVQRCETPTPNTPPERPEPPVPPAPPAPPAVPVDPSHALPPMPVAPVPSAPAPSGTAAAERDVQQQPMLAVTGASEGAAQLATAALAVLVGGALLFSAKHLRRS